YLPRDDVYRMKEGVVRLDYMTTAHSSWFSRPHDAQLASEAYKCLQQWLLHFVLGGVYTQFKRDILDYRAQLDSDPSVRSSLGV
ncbi:MAG: hypothetical protein ACYCYF_04445, partial [Anaerolineae bacterium]